MSFKVTNRSSLKTSAWLADVAVSTWKNARAPVLGTLKLQQFDVVSHINTELVGQQIRDTFNRIRGEIGDDPTKTERVTSDGEMAASIHKAMSGITTREASDPDFWAYLTCNLCPQYTRWRWNTPKPAALWTRYAGNIRRNALARLWWWAEITYDQEKPIGDPKRYAVTRNVSGRQSLMLWFTDCAFSGNPLVAKKLAELQESEELNDSAQKKICRTVNRVARLTCLDFVSTTEESDALCQRAYTVSQLLET